MTRAFEDVIRATALHQLELGIIEGQESVQDKISRDVDLHKGKSGFLKIVSFKNSCIVSPFVPILCKYNSAKPN